MVEKKCQSNAKTSLCLPQRPEGHLRLLQNRDAPLSFLTTNELCSAISIAQTGDTESEKKENVSIKVKFATLILLAETAFKTAIVFPTNSHL